MASQFGQLSPLPPIRLLSVSLATKSVTREVGILCLESIPSECILGEPRPHWSWEHRRSSRSETFLYQQQRKYLESYEGLYIPHQPLEFNREKSPTKQSQDQASGWRMSCISWTFSLANESLGTATSGPTDLTFKCCKTKIEQTCKEIRLLNADVVQQAKKPDRMNQVHIKSMQPTNMQVDSNKGFLLRTMFWISFFSVHVHHINWHMIIRMLTFAIQTVQWFLPFRKERNTRSAWNPT